MALRKATAYSKRKVTPYTRKSKRKSRSYIKTVPNQIVVKFQMGENGLFKQGKLPFVVKMISEEDVQIRSNALEACRQFVNRKMEKEFKGQYYFEVKPYPHHVQRENKMLTGAGADRMQTGMQLSFGKAVTRAAIMKEGDVIFAIASSNKKADQTAKKILHQIKAKLPCRTKFVYEGPKYN